MDRMRYALELLFGIGFKVGFLVAIMGAFMMYLPLIQVAVNPLLEYIGFWDAFRASPQWMRVFGTGLLLMVVAVFVSLLKTWTEPLFDILFGKEDILTRK
jgi:hypothetical protein